MSEQVGTVEILVARVYPLDPETADHPSATLIFVAPGRYPLHRDFNAYYWMMTGTISRRNGIKLDDGLFMMGGPDGPSDSPEVSFPSPRFGLEQWADLTAEPVCTEGHPCQRLRILLDEEATR